MDRFQVMHDVGDVESMLVAVFRELVEMPAHEVELLRSQSDAWIVRLSNARTLPRETN
jgi:hypothetical protein